MWRRHVWYCAVCVCAVTSSTSTCAVLIRKHVMFKKLIFSLFLDVKCKEKYHWKLWILAKNFADSEFPIWIYDVGIFSYYFKIVKLFVYKLRFIYLSINKIIIMQSFISAKDQCKHRIFFYLLLFQFCFYELICASYDARKLIRSCFDFVVFLIYQTVVLNSFYDTKKKLNYKKNTWQ